MEFLAFILAGAFAGGFVNGLSGFGTSMTALAFWLYVLPPTIAAPLAVTCSMVGHLQTFPAIWRQINVKQVLPFILGGIGGIPFGVYLLSQITGDSFKLYLGILIIGYCVFMAAKKGKADCQSGIIQPNIAVDTLVGFFGGILCAQDFDALSRSDIWQVRYCVSSKLKPPSAGTRASLERLAGDPVAAVARQAFSIYTGMFVDVDQELEIYD